MLRWDRTLSTYLTSGSTYPSAREGAIRSAKNLYGVASPERKRHRGVVAAIAVPAGAGTC